MSNPMIIVNKYQGKCGVCGKRVPPQHGLVYLSEGGWVASHLDCSPEYAEVLYDRAEKAEKAAEASAAEAKALSDKLDIDPTPLNVETKQLAWSDETTWTYSYRGDGTLEEFKKVLETGAQSSSGQLRWSNGRKVVWLDPVAKLVTMQESISLCD